ncbi:MAG: superoxide dismutase family protein [Nitrospinota bacterium]
MRVSGGWIVAVAAMGLFFGAVPAHAAKARAALQAKSGSGVSGEVTFEEKNGGVLVRLSAAGVPAGAHGFHVHEKGDCSSPDGASAGGHFNPRKTPHGGPGDKRRHAGDLGNVTADAQGGVKHESLFAGFTLGRGPASALGKSVILHAKADDLKSQPTGDAGGRIACGVIEAVK